MTAGVIALRKYQADGITQIRALVRVGKKRILVVAATGAGKTVVFCVIAVSHIARGGRVLIVVHRAELIDQTVAQLHRMGIERVGVIAAGRDAHHDAPVIVASIQTLVSRDQMPEGITLLILDEAHHYMADEWNRVYTRYPDAIVLGFTATPERRDGRPMGDMFDDIVVMADTAQLIADGWLCGVEIVSIDWPIEEAATVTPASVLDILAEHRRGRPTVIFADSIAASKSLAAAARARGMTAGHIDCSTSASDRREILDVFAAGKTDVLCNVGVLTEGWDSPCAAVIVLARRFGHHGAYLQAVGRVLRQPDPPAPKIATIIDLFGSVHEHGSPADRRVYSLTGRAISVDATAKPPTKDCPRCYSEVPIAARRCEECGYEFPERERSTLSLSPGDVRVLTDADRRMGYIRWQSAKARANGYRPGWVVHRMIERFGADVMTPELWSAYRDLRDMT